MFLPSDQKLVSPLTSLNLSSPEKSHTGKQQQQTGKQTSKQTNKQVNTELCTSFLSSLFTSNSESLGGFPLPSSTSSSLKQTFIFTLIGQAGSTHTCAGICSPVVSLSFVFPSLAVHQAGFTATLLPRVIKPNQAGHRLIR